MKKFAKLSLVASMAIASFSAANAQDLAKAIQNVDVSGTIAYRYNDYEETTGGQDNSDSNNNYKIALSLKSKVNDDITANTRFIVGSSTNAGPASLSTHDNGDQNVDVSLSEVNFTYTGIKNTAITLGKQGLATPYSSHRDSMDNEQTGTGIVASTTWGPVTFAAAYFNQTNLNGSTETPSAVSISGDENVIFAGVMADFAGISVDASYIDLQEIFDAYTLGLNASYNVGDFKLSPYARYSSLDLDNSSQDNTLWKIGLRANMGIFGAHLGYGQTDDEGGVVGLDVGADTGYDEHWGVTLSNNADSSVVYASIDAQVIPSLNVALKYSNLDDDTSAKQDEEEIYTQLTYQMSKNFMGYIRFGQYEKENDNNSKDIDSTRGRLQVQYSF